MLRLTGLIAALLMLTGCLPGNTGVEAILDLRGKAFEDAVLQEVALEESSSLSAEDLIRLLRHIQVEAKGTPSYYFASLFQLACLRAESSQVGGLAQLFASIPLDSPDRYHTLPPVLTLIMERELVQLRATPPLLKFPEQDLPSLKWQKEMSPSLATASRFALSALVPFNETRKAAAEKQRIDFQTNGPLYWKTVDRFLLDQPNGGADELLAFHWDSWCGTGSDAFYESHTAMIFFALVHEKRYAEAVGAALAVTTSAEESSSERFNAQRREFLTLCGIDGGKLIAGTLAARDIGYCNQHLSRSDLLRLIDRNQPEQALKYLIEIERLVSHQVGTEYFVQAIAPLRELQESRGKRGFFSNWFSSTPNPVESREATLR